MVPKVGSVVIYKTYNRLGDVLRRERRRIIRVLKNMKGRPIVEWESHRAQGICMPSTWNEWLRGVDESRRRRISVQRSGK